MPTVKKLALVSLLLATFVLADGNAPLNTPGATTVAITAQQATTTCVTANAAAAAQATATVPAVQGQFFYVTLVEVAYSAIAAPAATLLATTTTNFPGTFSVSQAMQAAVGENRVSYSFGSGGLKSSAASTATVITGNAGVASISQSIKLCGFYAP